MAQPARIQGKPLPEAGDDSQSSRAVTHLRSLLLAGEFRPGERIAELSLVERLGVSRTPARLALERLAQEGLVEPQRNGGFTVRGFLLSELWDAIAARAALEGTAARLAAERWSDAALLEELEECTRGMDALTELSTEQQAQYSELNARFHHGILELSKSSMLAWGMERFQSIPFAAPSRRVLPVSRQIMQDAMTQHRALLAAIRARDADRAESLAREHALLARRNLELALQDKNILSRVPGASLIRITASGFLEPGEASRSALYSAQV